MPSFKDDLTEQEIRDVAAFVSGSYAGDSTARGPERRRASRLCLKVRVRHAAHRCEPAADARAPLAGGRERVRARPRAPTARSRRRPARWACPPSPTLATRGTASARAGSSSTSCSSSRRTHRTGVEPGGTARVVFAVLERRAPVGRDGLVHPHLEAADGRWHALWGATLDEQVATSWRRSPTPRPPRRRSRSTGDTRGVRPRPLRLRGRRARAARPARRGRSALTAASPRVAGAAEHFLAGLAAPSAGAARRRRLPALERRLAAWVDGGLARRSRAPWNLGLRLDETDGRRGAGDAPPVVLELWLEAADDPTLALPRRCSTSGARRGVRASCARATRGAPSTSGSQTIEPVLAERGHRSRRRPADRTSSSTPSRCARSSARPCRGSRQLGVPVRLPREWVASSSRIRVNLVATGSAGDVERAPDPRRDRVVRLAARDRGRRADEEELRELAAAKEPLDPPARQVARAPRSRGRARAPVPRAPRAARPASSSSSAPSPASRRTRPGVELGEVRLDASLDELLAGAGERRYRPLPTPPGMRHDLFPFQERGHGWLRLLGDLRVGRDPRRRHGPREDGAGDRDPRLRAGGGRRRGRPDARRLPDERRAAVGARDRPLRAGAARPPPPRAGAPRGAAFVDAAGEATSSSRRTTSRRATSSCSRDSTWDRLLLDEAQDAKNPRTKRHRALRRIPRRRTLALTGTPIENRLGELWAIMDLVNPGCSARARRSSGRSRARSRCGATRRRSSGSARSSARSCSAGRRTRPRSTSSSRRSRSPRSPCRLTVEQASLYRATVDRWMPRIEQHERAFDRRGAVLAMLGQLKQVCNHPELVLPTGRAARRALGEARAARRDARGRAAGRQGARLHPVPGLRPARAAPRASASTATSASSTAGSRPAHATSSSPGSSRERPLGARRLAARRRPRAQPPGREPRRPLRPLVEPGRRAAGDRPRPPARPAQAGLRVEPRLHRDPRGADRRAARREARARRPGAWPAAPTTGSPSSTSTRSARPSPSRPRRSEEAA